MPMMYFHHFPISSRGRQHPPSGRNAAGGVLQVIDQLAGKLHGKVLAAPCQCMVVVGTRMSTPGQKKIGFMVWEIKFLLKNGPMMSQVAFKGGSGFQTENLLTSRWDLETIQHLLDLGRISWGRSILAA